jgi:serine-type D-Ala-D-Ala carboxypeptidase
MNTSVMILRGMTLFAAIASVGLAAASEVTRLPEAPPAEVGVDSSRLAVIDEIVEEGLRREKMPGCVVLVGCRGHIVHRRAYGLRAIEPQSEEMTVDTIFDVASLTKPVATATSVMLLIEEGKIDLDAPASTYLPEFAGEEKETITVRQLLTHQGGLIADNSLSDYLEGPELAWERITALDLVDDPGTRFIYSDVSFIVLGKLVERVSGQPLNEFARERIYQTLGMHETGFLPPEALQPRIAPTEKHGGEWLRGTVHDPRSREMGGVAGHAGLFSTADDLALYAQTLIDGGRRGDIQLLKPETIALMNTPHETTGGLRSLGWDKRSVYSSNRGDLMSNEAFGHGGFTGTALWIDPPQELLVIFLSNRLHPDGKGSVNDLAGRIGTVAAAALLPR